MKKLIFSIIELAISYLTFAHILVSPIHLVRVPTNQFYKFEK